MDGLSFLGGLMFKLKDKLTFINIDQNYLKYLHDNCAEVYYKPIKYDNKPYLGILMNKEYSFCLKIMNSIIQKANKIYDKQMETGKVIKFCCDFKLLEQKCEEYKVPDER